jgi:hypothetical protein
VRFSLMPESRRAPARHPHVTDPERIAAIDDFVEAGYEVHLNFSPVVLRPGWHDDWRLLLMHLDDRVESADEGAVGGGDLLLTHNRDLHEVNLGVAPKGRGRVVDPGTQQPKRSQSGQWNVRYRTNVKRRASNC